MADIVLGNNGKATIEAAIESDGGGGLAFVDLGVVNAVDLLDGPQTLYTPHDEQFVMIMATTDGFILMDGNAPGGNYIWMVGQNTGALDPTVVAMPRRQFVNTGQPFGEFSILSYFSAQPRGAMVMVGTDPIVAIMYTALSDYPILQTSPAWAANHSYGTFALILGPDSHIWSANDGGGTSGMSTPDFAGNEDGTVVDNDITWTDEGLIPTQGSLHLYALVSP